MYGFQRFEKGRWHRHGAVDSLAAFLEALKNEDAGTDVHTGCRQGQRLGDAATGMRQRRTERPNSERGILGG